MYDEYRPCRFCGREFSPTEMPQGTALSGRICYICYRQRNNAWRRTAVGRSTVREDKAKNHRAGREILHALKSKPCMDCGRTFPPDAMHFDHREPSMKLRTVSSLVTRPRAMLAEIEKCDLVCAVCHAVRTAKQRAAGLIKYGRPRKPQDA